MAGRHWKHPLFQNTMVCLTSHASYCKQTQLLFFFPLWTILSSSLTCKTCISLSIHPSLSRKDTVAVSKPSHPQYCTLQLAVSKTLKKWTPTSWGRRQGNPCLSFLQNKCELIGVTGVSWTPRGHEHTFRERGVLRCLPATSELQASFGTLQGQPHRRTLLNPVLTGSFSPPWAPEPLSVQSSVPCAMALTVLVCFKVLVRVH